MMSLSETRNVMVTVGHASCGIVLDKFFQKADERIILTGRVDCRGCKGELGVFVEGGLAERLVHVMVEAR